ncbi:MAG: flavodoxin domain-containing protein [Spirochaetes bacterium]|nr:flavodoxin domain-containing protein [Spirochaetota bacterium]MBU0954813.1 flavodoxin domain-containing protein [Spirochaetota bacterium]
MSILIVYDSVFGNTEKLAQAMAASAGSEAKAVRVGEVDEKLLTAATVLVVASPTRAFSATPAIKNWLKGLRSGALNGKKAAAFDTRVDTAKINSRFLLVMVKLFGYAAEPLSRMLAKKGALIAAQPAGFYVDDSEGPLTAGEIERAQQWLSGLLA